MPKITRTFTIEFSLYEALKAHCKSVDRPMSGLVEQGIKLVIGLPPEVKAEAQDDELGSTRATKEVLEVLKSLGHGWHCDRDIVKESGASPGVVGRALKTLKREGKAFEWGKVCMPVSKGKHGYGAFETAFSGQYFPSDTWGSAWSTETPMQALERVLVGYETGAYEGRADRVELASNYALAVEDIVPFREACVAAFWPVISRTLPGFGTVIQNFVELEAELEAETKERKKASDAEYERKQKEIRDIMREDRRAAAEMDGKDPDAEDDEEDDSDV